MAKFYGKIGFGETVESPPGSGVREVVVTEYPYYGDIVRQAYSAPSGEKINSDISLNVEVSILADPFARDHMFAMKYIELYGERWSVEKVRPVERRLFITPGGVYNGPTPGTSG